jgi:hypothetical protein
MENEVSVEETKGFEVYTTASGSNDQRLLDLIVAMGSTSRRQGGHVGNAERVHQVEDPEQGHIELWRITVLD